MVFRKRTTNKSAYKIIMYDLECLELKKTVNNKYHLEMLEKNLNDIFGIKDKGEL